MTQNKDSKKLYLVELTGMTYSSGCSPIYGKAYVVATNADEAYKKVRKRLDDKDLGFSGEREMKSVTLLAEETDYPDIRTLLYT